MRATLRSSHEADENTMKTHGLPHYAAALAALLIAGCVSRSSPVVVAEPVSPPGLHVLHPSLELQYLSCDYKHWDAKGYDRKPKPRGRPPVPLNMELSLHRDGVSALHLHENKDTAREAFVYAMLASNVYRDPEKKPRFVVPGWEPPKRLVAKSSLEMEIVERIENGEVAEVAIVFEGTDEWPDWQANASIWIEPRQYEQAQKQVTELLKDARYARARIVLVGHSLGGGIAINVALRQSTPARPMHVYVFNTSPRGFYDAPATLGAGTLDIIDEHGEWLRLGRALWWGKFRRLDAPKTYNFLNFNKRSLLKSVNEHSIYRLSRALLLLAVGTGDAKAKEAFRANFSRPLTWSRSAERQRYLPGKQYDEDLCSDILDRDLPAPKSASQASAHVP
jgi:hypothetical protein